MATFTNPDTVHRASVGAIAPAAWGDTVNDDINFLAGTLGNLVSTSETTTSTTYTDLTTSGPSVSLTTGAHVLVIVNAQMSNNTASDGSAMSFAISGATTAAASDSFAAVAALVTANAAAACAGVFYLAVNAGVNVFTAKYRAITGGTATFLRRTITAIPLP